MGGSMDENREMLLARLQNPQTKTSGKWYIGHSYLKEGLEFVIIFPNFNIIILFLHKQFAIISSVLL